MDAFLKNTQLILSNIVFAGFLCLLVSITQAQDLSLNTIQTGEVSAGSSEAWSFIAQEGQLFSVLVTSATLDSIVSIEDLNGNTLISNDDYHYPESRDALVEAFTAPYSGTYTITVSGFGDSSGEYNLSILSGYSQVQAEDTFDGSSGWQTVDLGTEQSPELDNDNGTLNLSYEGIDERAIVLGILPTSDVYYFRTMFENVTGNEGWRVGIVFRYVNVFNYYLLLLNHNGAWRLSIIEDGEERTLRDWGTHPAIRPGVTEFSLGILVNIAGYDIFYNDQFIGSHVDTTFSDGQIGFAVNTVSAIGSRVTAHIDEFILTAPIQIESNYLFPSNLADGSSTYTAHELERRLLIPSGGVMILNIPESFAQQVNAGVSRFPIASELPLENFVIGATINWRKSSDILTGCGLVVRDDLETDTYVLAYVDSADGYGLALRRDSEFSENIFHENPEIAKLPAQLVLVVLEDNAHFYLNQVYVGTLKADTGFNGVGEAVVNFEAVNTECTFNNLWIWTWD